MSKKKTRISKARAQQLIQEKLTARLGKANASPKPKRHASKDEAEKLIREFLSTRIKNKKILNEYERLRENREDFYSRVALNVAEQVAGKSLDKNMLNEGVWDSVKNFFSRSDNANTAEVSPKLQKALEDESAKLAKQMFSDFKRDFQGFPNVKDQEVFEKGMVALGVMYNSIYSAAMEGQMPVPVANSIIQSLKEYTEASLGDLSTVYKFMKEEEGANVVIEEAVGDLEKVVPLEKIMKYKGAGKFADLGDMPLDTLPANVTLNKVKELYRARLAHSAGELQGKAFNDHTLDKDWKGLMKRLYGDPADPNLSKLQRKAAHDASTLGIGGWDLDASAGINSQVGGGGKKAQKIHNWLRKQVKADNEAIQNNEIIPSLGRYSDISPGIKSVDPNGIERVLDDGTRVLSGGERVMDPTAGLKGFDASKLDTGPDAAGVAKKAAKKAAGGKAAGAAGAGDAAAGAGDAAAGTPRIGGGQAPGDSMDIAKGFEQGQQSMTGKMGPDAATVGQFARDVSKATRVGDIAGVTSIPKLYHAAGSYSGLMNWLYPGMKTAAASKAMMGSLALVGIPAVLAGATIALAAKKWMGHSRQGGLKELAGTMVEVDPAKALPYSPEKAEEASEQSQALATGDVERAEEIQTQVETRAVDTAIQQVQQAPQGAQVVQQTGGVLEKLLGAQTAQAFVDVANGKRNMENLTPVEQDIVKAVLKNFQRGATEEEAEKAADTVEQIAPAVEDIKAAEEDPEAAAAEEPAEEPKAEPAATEPPADDAAAQKAADAESDLDTVSPAAAAKKAPEKEPGAPAAKAAGPQQPVAGTTQGGMAAMAQAAGVPPATPAAADAESPPEEEKEDEPQKKKVAEQKINETFGRWKKIAGIIRGNS
tara:strand:+ start:11059 stop:13692 length:2634 start_codon:yes stop_codon:yes gene_type:complete